MTPNKKTIEKFMEGFNKSDHEQILSCLTDDIEWVIPGFNHLHGKQAFDKEIENEAFVGRPKIVISRVIEENNVVIAEGRATSRKKEGGSHTGLFCDVFEMKDGKIKKLTSYLVELKDE